MATWRCTQFFKHEHKSRWTARLCRWAQVVTMMNPAVKLLSRLVNRRLGGTFTLRHSHRNLCAGLYVGLLVGSGIATAVLLLLRG